MSEWKRRGKDKGRIKREGRERVRSLTGQGRRREVTLTAPCGTARWRTPNSQTNHDKVLAARNLEETSDQVHAPAGWVYPRAIWTPTPAVVQRVADGGTGTFLNTHTHTHTSAHNDESSPRLPSLEINVFPGGSSATFLYAFLVSPS